LKGNFSMPLCAICKNLDFAAFSHRQPVQPLQFSESLTPDSPLFYLYIRDDESDSEGAELIQHWPSLEALESSGQTCRLCSLMNHCLEEFRQGQATTRKLGFYVEDKYALWLHSQHDADGFQILGEVKFPPPAPGHRLFYLLGGIGFRVIDNGKISTLVSRGIKS
jgi:hypothetical protein